MVATEIPAITDPMGAHWRQPDRAQILIDEKHAVMTANTLRELADYSCSMPTAVYPGKMWRCRRNYDDESKGWLLRWYGYSPEPGYCSNHQRLILVIA